MISILIFNIHLVYSWSPQESMAYPVFDTIDGIVTSNKLGVRNTKAIQRPKKVGIYYQDTSCLVPRKVEPL